MVFASQEEEFVMWNRFLTYLFLALGHSFLITTNQNIVCTICLLIIRKLDLPYKN